MGNKKQINGYALSRIWFDFVFETTETVTPIHAALYFWIIDLANRLGWKDVFGLPTGYSMEAIGLKSYRSYKKALDDLIRWGFIELRAKSFNQHSSNQIALVLKAKAEAKADEVALVLKTKAQPKQRQKLSSHNKTIKTEQTLKKGGDKSPSSFQKDFIEQIIEEFQSVFTGYIITSPGKEKSSAAKLLSVFKAQYPDLSSDEMLKKLRSYFEKCNNIGDKWYRANMSLSLMVSKYNEINNLLNRPPQRAGASPDLSEVDNDNFLNLQ